MPEKVGKSETKKQMIRLPTGIIDLLDELIKESGIYATKPDFIIYSMRIYLNTILDALSLMIESEIDPQSTNEELSKLKEIISDPDLLTDIFIKNKIGMLSLIENLDQEIVGKESKPLMIYIPVGLAETIEYIMKKTKIASKMIDFIKQSISYNLSRFYYHDSMIDLLQIQDEKGSFDREDWYKAMRVTRISEMSAYGSVIKQDDALIQYFLKNSIKKFE